MEVLQATTKLLIGNIVERIEMPIMVGLQAVQAIVEALLTTAKAPVGEVVGEVVGKVVGKIAREATEGMHGAGATPMKVPSRWVLQLDIPYGDDE